MNKYFIAAWLSLALAVAFLVASIASGEDSVHLFLIFPVITVNSLYSGLGALFIFLFFILLIMGFASGYELVGWDELQREFFEDSDQKGGGAGQAPPKGAKRTRIEGGGVVLLGPIPLVFGSNTKLTLILVVLTFAIMVVALMIFLM